MNNATLEKLLGAIIEDSVNTIFSASQGEAYKNIKIHHQVILKCSNLTSRRYGKCIKIYISKVKSYKS